MGSAHLDIGMAHQKYGRATIIIENKILIPTRTGLLKDRLIQLEKRSREMAVEICSCQQVNSIKPLHRVPLTVELWNTLGLDKQKMLIWH